MSQIGEKLADLRREKGLCQKEIAKCLKVTVGTISNYENGVHEPDLDTLGMLADFYGVTVDYLLGRTTYRYKVEDWNTPLIDHYTVGDVVNISTQLPKDDKLRLLDYLKLLQTCNQIKEKKQ